MRSQIAAATNANAREGRLIGSCPDQSALSGTSVKIVTLSSHPPVNGVLPTAFASSEKKKRFGGRRALAKPLQNKRSDSNGLGCDAPFLAGIVEPLPHVGPGSVSRPTVHIIKHHAAVLDDNLIVTAAGRDNGPLLAIIAERGPQVHSRAISQSAVHRVEDCPAVNVGDGEYTTTGAGESPLLAGVAERGP